MSDTYPTTYKDALKLAFDFQFEIFLDIGVGFVRCHPGCTGTNLTVYFGQVEALEESFLYCVQKALFPEIQSPLEGNFEEEGSLQWHKSMW